MSDSSSAKPRNYQEKFNQFWKGNVRLMLWLLAVWAVAGLGCGILFADSLNEYRLGGIPLGFWFAQQGSIIVFVAVILVYCIIANRRDTQHHEDVKGEESQSGGGI